MHSKYFVNDKSRMCQLAVGPGTAEEAIKEGFREVTLEELEAFRAVTQKARDAGWNPHGISYAKFLSSHPEFQPA